jgi:hypothetical protein
MATKTVLDDFVDSGQRHILRLLRPSAFTGRSVAERKAHRPPRLQLRSGRNSMAAWAREFQAPRAYNSR